MPDTARSLSLVLNSQAGIRTWQEYLYRDFHQNPELSLAEYRTSEVVAEQLGNLGFDVYPRIGGTGVVGILRNGGGAAVLLRADMDALPVLEATGLPYASTVIAKKATGADVPVAHACGHDVHMACLLGAARLLSESREAWRGTLVTIFQPAEERGRGALRMVRDGLSEILPPIDVALGQHVVPIPAGQVATRSGPAWATADSITITLHGRGGHGSMPDRTVDSVVLAAAVVMRLQTIVAREVEPGVPAVLTVGSIQAGDRASILPEQAVLKLTVRTYNFGVRKSVIAAIERVVRAECLASGSPRDPEFEYGDPFPLIDNDPTVTARVNDAFKAAFGEKAHEAPRTSASEDFSDLPTSLGAPYTFWQLGCVDPDRYHAAVVSGRVAVDIPTNHSPSFAPVIQPTLETGTRALVVAALAWLADR